MKGVDPSLYTKKYFLKHCSGHDVFKKTSGRKLGPRLNYLANFIPNLNGLTVLDIGCGRGEMVFWAARNGAEKVIGIDYSEVAIKLSKKALKNQSRDIGKSRISFFVMNAKDIQYEDNSFDIIFLIEVLEHLYDYEQEIVLKEIKRILKPGGRLFLHTAPSRWFIDYTYKLWCYPLSSLMVKLSNAVTRRNYPNLQHPSLIKNVYHMTMHVGEIDYFSLINLCNKVGFRGKILSTNITIVKPELSWKDKLYNFFVFLHPISKKFPFNIFWGNDFVSLLSIENI